ncbi:MAG: type II toxin-antitoxin system VapC family toxin [Alphaproteobacteria bacterium]|nr:type II toxin-antitoxin system VapC family toxin [Alphaproteobacteria bacterium]
MFLLDTVVLSELRKHPGQRNRNVVAWIAKIPSQDLFVSVVTIGEIERGIERQRGTGDPFADELATWLDVVLRAYDGRILPVTVPVARRWGRLSQRLGNKGLDLAIAATALEHGLTVVTRNVSDFTPAGVAVVNPFEQAALVS